MPTPQKILIALLVITLIAFSIISFHIDEKDFEQSQETIQHFSETLEKHKNSDKGLLQQAKDTNKQMETIFSQHPDVQSVQVDCRITTCHLTTQFKILDLGSPSYREFLQNIPKVRSKLMAIYVKDHELQMILKPKR